MCFERFVSTAFATMIGDDVCFVWLLVIQAPLRIDIEIISKIDFKDKIQKKTYDSGSGFDR